MGYLVFGFVMKVDTSISNLEMCVTDWIMLEFTTQYEYICFRGASFLFASLVTKVFA